MSGFLAEIDSAGGRAQLEALICEFVVGEDKEAVDALLGTVDENGLRSENTLMAVVMLQKQNRVKPTLYTKLSALSSELKKRPIVPPRKTATPKAPPKPSGLKPGRKMTLNWQHLFAINVVDQGAFTREDIAQLIGMDDTVIPALKMSAVDWIIDDSMRAYRFESKLVDGKYTFKSKRDWRKFQMQKWQAEGRPIPKGLTLPLMPSKELWDGFTRLS